ncbi:MAG TPA: hypothetical protein VK975_00810 [Acidimicrobiales bacterium]|nr:hypothetical protein [Acidimicrobiales bacterium]
MRARGTSRYGRAALQSEVAMVEQAAEGFRHMAIFSAACHIGELVAGCEVDEEAAEAFLIDAGRSLTGGRLTDQEVRRQVRQGLARGKRTPRTAPTKGTMLRDRTDAVLAVVEWWEAVQCHEWKGRTAGTTLRILAAFAILGAKVGKVRLEESYREVAEAAGVSVGTIAKHKARWLPFVRQVSVGNRITASRTVWQLVVRANGNRPASPAGKASGLFPNARTLSDPAHNAWHQRPNDWRVYCLLTEEVTSAAHLVEVTGLHPSTIGRIGARLVDLGAVERDEDGWHVVPADAEALQLAGEDHADHLRLRHAKDRALHKTWRTELIERRELPGAGKFRQLRRLHRPDPAPRESAAARKDSVAPEPSYRSRKAA